MPERALVLFDLDGTLVDPRDDLSASVNAALRGLGLPERTRDEVAGFIGEGARRLLEKAVSPRLDLVDPGLALFYEHYGEHLLDRTRPYPGVPEMLRSLGGPLGVATNKPGRFARRILAGLGLLDAFVAVLGGDDGPRKPDPALVDRLRALVAAPRERTVLVGDSRVDVATARAAGVELIAVAWGLGSRQELAEAGARDAEIVASVEELGRRLRS